MSEFSFGDYGLGDVDTDRGEAVLKQFYDAMQSLYGASFTLSFDELLAKYRSNVLGIGLAANVANMDTNATGTAMFNLASQGNGKIPASWNGIVAALSNQATSISWVDAVVQTAKDSAADIGVGLQQTGQTLIDAGKITLQTANYAKYLIYVLPLVALWWFGRNKDSLSEAVAKRAIRSIEGSGE